MASSLVTAFRQQFPRGSILSEVLTIHDGWFVVRVTIGVDGTTLSQALAANNSLELAEDIACNRALERLALTPNASEGQGEKGTPPHRSPVAALPLATPSGLPLTETSPTPAISTATAVEQPPNGFTPRPEAETNNPPELIPQPTPNPPAAPPPQPELPPQAPLAQDVPDKRSNPVLSLATPPVPAPAEPTNPAPPLQSKDSTNLANKLGLGNVAADPIDLSDIIAQTDVELQRLGWDVNQGREFLEKTYGKRSRHDLTDEELLEFLLYLESQPMPSV